MLVLLGQVVPGATQNNPPFFTILGKLDGATDPPNAHAYVSVANPQTGEFMDGLTTENFSVELSGEEIPVTNVESETSGIAVAIVIDRGGIGRDRRREQVVDLADALLSRLNVDGSSTTDIVGMIGIRGRDEIKEEQGRDLDPVVPFTDFDPIQISNQFDALRNDRVGEATPLYDGLDEAIEWFTKNTDADMQRQLNHRRKVIVVFSDGIDRKFSREAHETVIINKCKESDISIYSIRMAAGSTDADNMEVLARQTSGQYLTYQSEEDSEKIHSAFDGLVTQRQSYKIVFPVIREKGDYQAEITVVDTPLGDATETGSVSGVLVSPKLTLNPPPQTEYTVPYSKTLDGFIETRLPMSVTVTFPDGVVRELGEVIYTANGSDIGRSGAAPAYPFDWNVTNLVTVTEKLETEDYSLAAKFRDPLLDNLVVSDSANVQVRWEPITYTFWEKALNWLKSEWWVILVGLGLIIGLVTVWVMLMRAKSELASKVAKSATGILGRVTQPLRGGGGPAYGKLVIMQGMNKGNEFKLSAPVAKVGRDPQFSDFALQDPHVSNPHFTIHREQREFFIVEEGSTNGTVLNGQRLTPNQRTPLPSDAVIQAGNVQIQFKRIGGTTRQIGGNDGGNNTLQASQQQARGPVGMQQQSNHGNQQSSSPSGYGGTTQPPQI